jgi:hypothetical protein
MAKITDPDGLTRASTHANLGVDGNIFINTAYHMFNLAPFGSLDAEDGVTLQAIYSYLKEEWKTDANLIKYPFPMVAITPEQFEFVDGWQPANMDTVYLFKDGGFAVKDSNGNSTSEFAGIITLGTLGAADQVYYQQTNDGTAKNIFATGPVNQCVKTYGVASGNTFSFNDAGPAIASHDLGPDASEKFDLSTSYHLTITVDAEGPTEVNIQGSTPATTDIDEVIDKINLAFAGSPATKSGTGASARIVLSGTATTNGNFIVVADGTTTTGAMAKFTSMGGQMVAEAGPQVTTSAGMVTTFHPGDEVTVTGSASNAGKSFLIKTIRSDYMQMTADSANSNVLVDEAAGTAATFTADARGYYKTFVREYQKLYAQSEIADIGVSNLTYQAYRFPLANADDLKISHNDAAVSTTLPYTDMDITYLVGTGFTTASVKAYVLNEVGQDTAGRWFRCSVAGTLNAAGVANYTANGGTGTFVSYAGERQIGATYYVYNIIVDADASGNGGNPTAEQIYEFIQYSLRRNADIDDGTGTVIGKTADILLSFVGDTLVTEPGVYVDDFAQTDINRLEFYDYNGVKRVFPFVAAGTINFNDNLVTDGGAVYRMFFTNDDAGNNTGADFGTASATLVDDNSDVDIAGNVSGASVQFTYDYDGNVQRGAASAGTDAPVTIVAIGLTKAQYVKATGVIGRSNANSFSLVASLERNYSNPA